MTTEAIRVLGVVWGQGGGADGSNPARKVGVLVAGLCLGVLICVTRTCLAQAIPPMGQEPPQVVWAEPDAGDTLVDPSLVELRVEFDQDMSKGGFSICGGGPTFPGTGNPKWLDARTLVLPIKLEPGKTYALGINCPSAQNFKSAAGVKLEPYSIWFTTRAADAPAPVEITAEDRKRAIDGLRTYIDQSYSHRDVRRVDWPAVIAGMERNAERAKSCGALARVIARGLAPAQDVHLTVRAGGSTLATHKPVYALNFDRTVIEKLLTDFRCDGTVVTGMYRGLPYVMIPAWSGSAKEHERALAFVDAHADAAGIIIDVRPNTGGDERLARTLASRFALKPTAYARSRVRTPGGIDGWAEPVERVVEPDATKPAKLHGKAVVLMGPANMSSNESFLRMMRHAGGAKLVGEKSYGSSGNPKPFDLGCGIMLMLPSWLDSDVDGTPTEGRGVTPDVRVEWAVTKDDPDPVLRRGAELLEKLKGEEPKGVP